MSYDNKRIPRKLKKRIKKIANPIRYLEWTLKNAINDEVHRELKATKGIVYHYLGVPISQN